MKHTILLTAMASSAVTLLAVWAYGQGTVTSKVKLDNARVRVVEVTAPPGVPRYRHIRERDQVIVFLDESRYERTDPKSGQKTTQTRQAGDVIWHSRGEAAPQLVNTGSRPYRTIVIELK